jgi:hypothetical protein
LGAGLASAAVALAITALVVLVGDRSVLRALLREARP